MARWSGENLPDMGLKGERTWSEGQHAGWQQARRSAKQGKRGMQAKQASQKPTKHASCDGKRGSLLGAGDVRAVAVVLGAHVQEPNGILLDKNTAVNIRILAGQKPTVCPLSHTSHAHTHTLHTISHPQDLVVGGASMAVVQGGTGGPARANARLHAKKDG